jgi:hypothetical protein
VSAGWRWLPQDARGRDLPASESFASQEEAEAWMGHAWEALLQSGAEHVVLMGDDDKVRYRMGLREG